MEPGAKKGGRPKKKPEEIKGNVVRVRLTDAEYRDLEAKAALCRLSPGIYLRDVALDRPLHPLPEINREAWAKLAPLTANLNQILRAKGRGEFALLPQALLEEIKDSVKKLRAGLRGDFYNL